MREVEVPPLSASVEHFRRVVARRAARRNRLRQAAVGGAVAVALVATGLVWAELPGTGGDVHRSAARPPTTTTPGPSAAGPSPLSPSAAGPSAANGRTQDRASPTTIPPVGPPWSLAGAAVLRDPPSGSTHPVAAGTPIIVVLTAPATGSWGSAHVTQGLGSALAPVVPQSGDARGNVQVYLKALRPGTARVEVPCLGNPAASWHGTIEVTVPAGHR